MPELPEVETVCRALDSTMRNRIIKHVEVKRRDLRVPVPDDFENRVAGAKIISLTRRGKYILVYLDNGNGFVIHLGMSGVIAFHPSRDEYIPAMHDHIVFETNTDSVFTFNDPRRFGQIISFSQGEEGRISALAAMGPEPLSDDFTAAYLAGELKRRKGPVKGALMDQSLIAGLGNIYVCEALYYAGISPRRKSATIQGKRAEKLAASIRTVLGKAIEAGGSSLRDYKNVDGAPGYFQHHFAVYDKKGRACPDCICQAKDSALLENLENNRGIKHIVQSGRSTFFCSIKQR